MQKNQFIPSIHTSDTVNFRVPLHDRPYPILTIPTPKLFSHLSTCINLYRAKRSVNSISSFLRYGKFLRVQRTDWPYQFLIMTNQKLFNQLLIFASLYQHAKNEVVSPICSGQIVHLKIMLSDWEHFGLYIRNKIFSKYRICAGTQQIVNIFITEQIKWKLMTKFFFEFKKTYFWFISPIFGAI